MDEFATLAFAHAKLSGNRTVRINWWQCAEVIKAFAFVRKLRNIPCARLHNGIANIVWAMVRNSCCHALTEWHTELLLRIRHKIVKVRRVLHIAFVHVSKTVHDWLPLDITQVSKERELHSAVEPNLFLRNGNRHRIISEEQGLEPSLVQGPVADSDVLGHV
jgi:hypothetical protein